MVVDQPLNQIGDVPLSASGRIQLAAHLGETPIDVSAEVTEVLTKGVETRRCSVSEVADLGSDLGDIPVGCAGEDPCRRGILLGRIKPPTDVAEFVLTHGYQPSPVTCAERAPSHWSCGQRLNTQSLQFADPNAFASTFWRSNEIRDSTGIFRASASKIPLRTCLLASNCQAGLSTP